MFDPERVMWIIRLSETHRKGGIDRMCGLEPTAMHEMSAAWPRHDYYSQPYIAWIHGCSMMFQLCDMILCLRERMVLGSQALRTQHRTHLPNVLNTGNKTATMNDNDKTSKGLLRA